MPTKLKLSLFDKHYKDHKAPHTLYRELIAKYAESNSKILDYGAGRGDSNWIYPEHVDEIYGTDISEKVLSNPRLISAGVLVDGIIPFPDSYFDIVISTWVLEHLPEPEQSFEEIRRVLKPGGKFIFLTPNLYHYATIIARFTPDIFHKVLISKVFGKEEEEVYPTTYKANTARKLRKLSEITGFEIEQLFLAEPPPIYLGFTYVTFYLGYAYERIVGRTELLAGLRQSLIGVFVKKED